MTGRGRVCLFSLASGMAWGVIALLLGSRPMGGLIWGGLLSSPLIGLIAGAILVRLNPKRKLAAAAISLVTLYATAALFGIAMGMYDWLTGHPGRGTLEVIVQPVPAVWWGLTFTLYVLVLWPLAYWNHVLLWRIADRDLPSRE